jgi:type IV secretory pathway TrbD component
VETAVKLRSYLKDDSVLQSADRYDDIVQGLLDKILGFVYKNSVASFRKYTSGG